MPKWHLAVLPGSEKGSLSLIGSNGTKGAWKHSHLTKFLQKNTLPILIYDGYFLCERLLFFHENSKELTFDQSCLSQPLSLIFNMKSLAITLLILAACFLGYDYYLALPQERMVFERPPIDHSLANAASPTAQKVGESKRQQYMTSVPFRADPSPSSNSHASQANFSSQAPAQTPPQSPKLDSIEVLTENWQKIPSTAFPRPVTLVRDATFKLSNGASTVRAGAQVVALSLDKGLLIIAPSEASALRNSVSIDDTDFKSRLTAGYEKWKSEREAEFRRKAAEPRTQTAPAVGTTSAVDESGKPTRSGDGSYPLLLARMRAGSPSDITPQNVIRWGNAEMATIKGTPTWVIPVTYKTQTPFGEFDAETVVHVQKEKVVSWVYKGSGEEVP